MAKRKSGKRAYPWILADLEPLARPIGDAKLDPANINKHPPESITGIAAMLRKFGQRTTITVNRKTKFIAKGNGTWLAAKQLGWTHLAMVWTDDDSGDHAAYSVGDNRSAQLSKLDQALLAVEIPKMQARTPDLADALLMAELLPPGQLAGASSDPPAVVVPAVYAVQIEVASEAEQKTVFERMKREGFGKVKALTL